MDQPQNWLKTDKLLCFNVQRPKKLQFITFQPISSLQMPAPFSKQVLDAIGLQNMLKAQKNQEQKAGIFTKLFSCGACGCKAMSKQTLYEIQNHPNISKENQQHLRDSKKRQKFKELYKKLTKQNTSDSFDDNYKKYGHVNEQQWIEIICKRS